VGEALCDPEKLSLNIQPLSYTLETDSITVRYSVSDMVENSVLNVVLLENFVVFEVLKGENVGKTLKHYNVVRSFKTIPLVSKQGNVKLPPYNFNIKSGYKVVVYLQDKDNMAVL